jgi:5-methylcytosine-specific restriction endonuclease McrA
MGSILRQSVSLRRGSKMATQTFWQWVNEQAKESDGIYIVPTISESIVLGSIEYICETSYFYRGSETWGIEVWDEHMEDYFMDMRHTKQEIPRRIVYRTIREKYLSYQAGAKRSPKQSLAINRPRTRRSIPLGVRWRVMERDGRRCMACGASPATDAAIKLHVDHIVPVSRGGLSTLDNLQTLCEACNLGKSNRMPQ